jgi:hypothetical protein
VDVDPRPVVDEIGIEDARKPGKHHEIDIGQ